MKRILCLDIETTGFNENDEILQLAYMTNTGESFCDYYRPIHVTSWDDAEKVNNISPNMVRGKYPFQYEENIAHIQQAIAEADIIVGYNHAFFDIPFLEKYGINFEGKEIHDAMQMYRKTKPESKKLIKCAEHYGFAFTAHNAMEDVKATLYCYNKMINEGILPN